MQMPEEFEEFREWYGRLGGKHPASDMRAYGRLALPNRKGKLRPKPFVFGTAMLWDDGLVFLPKRNMLPLWGWLLAALGFVAIVAMLVVRLLADPDASGWGFYISFFLLFGAVSGFARRKMKLDSMKAVMHAAAGPLAAFVPLDRITDVEVYSLPGWGNPDRLRVVYTDPRKGQRQLILGNLGGGRKVGFEPHMLLRAIEARRKTVPPNQP